MRILSFFTVLLFASVSVLGQTYAEKLGYPKGAKVLILHVDDVGMSYDSNKGAIEAIENGVANSMSIMMPCPWVSGFSKYLKEHPKTDAGLHLTLTSEWENYRWGPLSGKKNTPGLVDKEGALWPSVPAVLQHASADEIEEEIRAQLDRSRTMGWEPTHLDSHMGTLFARPDYLERYVKVGIEEKIPVMFPGGHNSMVSQTVAEMGYNKDLIYQIGQKLWNAGLPVLDDLHNISYGWTGEKGTSDAELQAFKTKQYIETIKQLKPGLTMVIMHCTWPTEVFPEISSSGQTRKGDMLAMTDPAFKKFLAENNIVLTTWREAMERRQKLD
ncbi:polysaccharide deacetylase family protein [Marinilongibacter aquaticus]|uniref:polysaccharide deacetylase family protein n=1 Tax=Marinilongibacter aquaticus TaxID=2975157 RepID=UPI0021BD3231|nr:polysaccharide deacetylase family protein [Marinilongibacter aquaticus]UBM60481.1 polysaccharide deacetylase family protein [Marinilongibacter aquaticus]